MEESCLEIVYIVIMYFATLQIHILLYLMGITLAGNILWSLFHCYLFCKNRTVLYVGFFSTYKMFHYLAE